MRSFWTPSLVFSGAVLLRIVLLFYGLVQDAYSPLKYTDIDYFVFTDAARYVSRGHSPYDRETYRYTPLLAWLLLPTSWPGVGWFSFGKAVFSIADIFTGWLLALILRSRAGGSMNRESSMKFASIWLLNPMVATISTRGSSEGLLGVMVISLLWAVTNRRIKTAGVLLGLAVHFKIYPFIYAPALLVHLSWPRFPDEKAQTISKKYLAPLLSHENIELAASSLITFAGLNAAMYAMYGYPFLQHTYLHHVTRIDHRHNFSPYNTLLYLSSSSPSSAQTVKLESLAFIPQLLLSGVLIPFVLAKRDLPDTMLAQTFAFVALNKVCTSQYFIWFLLLAPLYLSHSSLVSRPRLGLAAAALWIGAQGLWLWQGYELEFLGHSTFVPGLWGSGLLFYVVNMWILGIIVGDIGKAAPEIVAQRNSKVES
ncbi:GPI mannosyltransferase 1 [Lambiella insularis]|nr:GPI mannosyltransferase 1 [Lambiella insularis]